ncbi:MAG: phospho-N-acetylmuramoyl-pentapeptide-transferase [Clostridia bacterium]|nr:phospho-N-acetylmuramoyl-pentapeptide-transferase [Clostridia bacterium]
MFMFAVYKNIILGFAVAFVVAVIATKLLIPVLRAMKAGQNIREDGPQSHLKKAGTPSMGGIAILIGIVAGVILTGHFSADSAVILVVLLLFGAIGFLDDYIKVKMKHNLGLRAWQKLLLQIAISVGLAIYMSAASHFGTCVFVPIANIYIDFGIWYVPFIAFVVVAMTNSVNLTDGLDGLASGVSAIVTLFFALLGAGLSMTSSSVCSAAICGACLGFLVFNRHPARVFMGDTGSLALGAGIAACATVMKLEFLLPVAGFIFVAEALSVIIQVVSFKSTGKRVFKMAPLHHHFELSGMKETSVVKMFWAVTAICCIISVCIL